MATCRQLQALESFLYALLQADAKAGKPEVAVTTAVVYVAQKGPATPEDAVMAYAQASFLGLSHASARGRMAPRKMEERMMTST